MIKFNFDIEQCPSFLASLESQGIYTYVYCIHYISCMFLTYLPTSKLTQNVQTTALPRGVGGIVLTNGSTTEEVLL